MITNEDQNIEAVGTGGLCRTTRRPTITRYWAKLPGASEYLPVQRMGEQGNSLAALETKQGNVSWYRRFRPASRIVTPISLLTIDRTAPGSRARGKS